MKPKDVKPSKVVRVYADGRVVEEPFEGWPGGHLEFVDAPDLGDELISCKECGAPKGRRVAKRLFETFVATDANTLVDGQKLVQANGPGNGGVVVLIEKRP